jgi:hypothetical protein
MRPLSLVRARAATSEARATPGGAMSTTPALTEPMSLPADSASWLQLPVPTPQAGQAGTWSHPYLSGFAATTACRSSGAHR